MIPEFSVIIPAHNEQAFLPGCLHSLRQAAQKISPLQVEIIVVINRCSDQTEQIAREHNCILVYNDKKNLSSIRNSGLKSASGKVIVTIDADSTMSLNLLEKILQIMQTTEYIGGGVLIVPERWSVGILLSFLALQPFFLFWGISAGAFFGLRQDFLAINGFNENMYSAEDIDFARRLKAYGRDRRKKFCNLFSARIVTSMRKFDRFGDWYALRHPLLMLSLLKGYKNKEADKLWYDFNG